MTTKLTILNHGPEQVTVTGGVMNVPLTIPAHRHAEVYLYDGAPLKVEESKPVVVPTLAGGPGEEH